MKNRNHGLAKTGDSALLIRKPFATDLQRDSSSDAQTLVEAHSKLGLQMPKEEAHGLCLDTISKNQSTTILHHQPVQTSGK